LRELREATTQPTAPRATENQNGVEPPLEPIQALMRKVGQRHIQDGQYQHEAADDKRGHW
jgi:hypothetical protein